MGGRRFYSLSDGEGQRGGCIEGKNRCALGRTAEDQLTVQTASKSIDKHERSCLSLHPVITKTEEYEETVPL